MGLYFPGDQEWSACSSRRRLSRQNSSSSSRIAFSWCQGMLPESARPLTNSVGVDWMRRARASASARGHFRGRLRTVEAGSEKIGLVRAGIPDPFQRLCEEIIRLDFLLIVKNPVVILPEQSRRPGGRRTGRRRRRPSAHGWICSSGRSRNTSRNWPAKALGRFSRSDRASSRQKPHWKSLKTTSWSLASLAGPWDGWPSGAQPAPARRRRADGPCGRAEPRDAGASRRR